MVDKIGKRLATRGRIGGSRLNTVYGNRDFAANDKLRVDQIDPSFTTGLCPEQAWCVGAGIGPASRPVGPGARRRLDYHQNHLRETEKEDIVSRWEGCVS